MEDGGGPKQSKGVRPPRDAKKDGGNGCPPADADADGRPLPLLLCLLLPPHAAVPALACPTIAAAVSTVAAAAAAAAHSDGRCRILLLRLMRLWALPWSPQLCVSAVDDMAVWLSWID